MKEKIVSRIKTSAGELQLSEDALCKHTIFIGSTGIGKIGFGSNAICERYEPITLANAPAGYVAIKLADGFQSNGLVEIERLYVDAPPMPENKRESEIDKCAKVLRTYLKAIDFNACLNGKFLDKDAL